MSNIELIKFEEFPQDPYTKAVAVLSVDGKYNVCYGKKQMKDGGQYWASPSFGVADGSGSKEYYEGFSMDSKKEDQKFKDFIKQAEEKLRGQAAALPKGSDVPFIQRPNEVSVNDGLPF
jgi:hypothetical protein